jgi:hypothetical protein
MFIKVTDSRYVNSDNVMEFVKTRDGWAAHNVDQTVSHFNGPEGEAVSAYLETVNKPLQMYTWGNSAPLTPGGIWSPGNSDPFAWYPVTEPGSHEGTQSPLAPMTRKQFEEEFIGDLKSLVASAAFPDAPGPVGGPTNRNTYADELLKQNLVVPPISPEDVASDQIVADHAKSKLPSVDPAVIILPPKPKKARSE